MSVRICAKCNVRESQVTGKLLCWACKQVGDKAYYRRNRAAVTERARVKRQQNRIHARSQARKFAWKYLYGLSQEDVSYLIGMQLNRCAICRTQMEMGRVSRRMLHVDHDHITGRVRGLLCKACNCTLGHMRDSAENLRRAAAYVEGTEAT